MKITVRFKGGQGSGNFGHAGIPGHTGGSASGGSSSGSLSKSEAFMQERKQTMLADGWTDDTYSHSSGERRTMYTKYGKFGRSAQISHTDKGIRISLFNPDGNYHYIKHTSDMGGARALSNRYLTERSFNPKKDAGFDLDLKYDVRK